MNLEKIIEDNLPCHFIEADIPDKAQEEPCWLGIDEAGRGPVLGPMVYGTCFSPISLKKEMEEMGFADSKTLTEAQRESIFEKIHAANDLIGWIVHVLSPTHISNCMLRRSKYNLNLLSHDTAAGLIQRAIDRGANIAEVYVDTVGPPDKYQDKLQKLFPSLKIVVEKKADATYQIVGAASICAKVARDKIVKEWKFSEGFEKKEEGFGSGYPGDPVTKKFMAESLDPVFGYPQLVRFSWSTASTIIDNKAVAVQWDDDEDEENQKPAGNAVISQYFTSNKDKREKQKHMFYQDRCLKQVSGF